MPFPVRFTRKLMALIIRLLLAVIVVIGVATLITQMYMLNDDYVDDMTEKKMLEMFGAKRGEREDVDPLDDYKWPTTTQFAAKPTTDLFTEKNGESDVEATTDLEGVSDVDMTAPPDDNLGAWFGVTSTPQAASTVIETDIITSTSGETEALPTVTTEPEEDDYVTTGPEGDDYVTTSSTTEAQTTETAPMMGIHGKVFWNEGNNEERHQVTETQPMTTEDFDEYSLDDGTMTSEQPNSARLEQNPHTTKMLITFDAVSTLSPREEEEEAGEDEDGITERERWETEVTETDSFGENQDTTIYDEMASVPSEKQDTFTEEDTASWEAQPILQPAINVSTAAIEPRSRPQYILPVFRGIGQGPNNQYLSFKAVVLYAILHNKTLVLPPFFNHHRITEDDVRSFQETFNVDLLGSFVPVATLDEFKRDCNNRVDAVLYTKPCLHPHSCYFDSVYRTMIPIFEILTGIKFPTKEEAEDKGTVPITMLPSDPIFTHETIYDFLHNIKDTFRTDSPCAAMFYPFPFMKLMMRAYSNNVFEKLEQHLARAHYIRMMADYYIRTVLKSQQFLAVHWRMNYDFKIVWCGRRLECRWGCQYIYKRNSSEEITTSFLGIMQAFNLSAVYFAAPQMQNNKLWTTLKTKIPNAFNSSSLVASLRGLDIPEMTSPLEEDNYVISLVEQELCYRASIFVGTAVSTWTYMVEQQRLGKGTLFMPDIFGDPEGKCR
ncbi:uncharacterized protein [Ptychodera flava]|uniref:uncharacterized protein isoform X2 n=1 Tax=Ptychodera flava TaxID=63121 RepID=UPI00396A458A